MLPPIDYLWDFFVGTTQDLNISKMVDFYEKNQNLSNDLSIHTWADQPTISFSDYYSKADLKEEDFGHPTMPAYKYAHLG